MIIEKDKKFFNYILGTFTYDFTYIFLCALAIFNLFAGIVIDKIVFKIIFFGISVLTYGYLTVKVYKMLKVYEDAQTKGN